MRKFFIPVAAAAVALSSTVALAATGTATIGQTNTVSGIVKSWNASNHVLTLADGSTYIMPTRDGASAFMNGQNVTITYKVMPNGNQAMSAAGSETSEADAGN